MDDLDAAILGAEGATDDTRPEGKNGKWPKMPDHGTGIDVVRDYLTEASRMPQGWRAATCERFGTEGTDAMVLVFAGPEGEGLYVRFAHQAHAGKPATLRAEMASQTSGLSRMHHPSQAQAGDFYNMCCALAGAISGADVEQVMREELRTYIDQAHALTGHGLTRSETLRAGLEALSARPEFRRKDAIYYLKTPNDELRSYERPVCLIDAVTGERWLRAGELATWMRHVSTAHQGGLSQSTLDSLLAEIGVTRHRLQTTGSKTPHLSFTLYRVPPVDAEGSP